MTKKKKTKQLSVRLDTDLIEAIEDATVYEGISKMDWIKRALIDAVDIAETKMSHRSVNEYVNGILDSHEFKKNMDWEKIPADIEDTRKKFLEQLVRKRKSSKENGGV